MITTKTARTVFQLNLSRRPRVSCLAQFQGEDHDADVEAATADGESALTT